MTNKVTIIKLTDQFTNQDVDHVIIDRGNDEYTSMRKSDYDAMQAEQSTPIVIDETATK
jgi:hypothetical protein